MEDAFRWLRRARGGYDLIFADPPYVKARGERDFGAELLAEDAVVSVLSADGLLVLETGDSEDVGCAATWERVDTRRYGGSHLHFYQRVSG